MRAQVMRVGDAFEYVEDEILPQSAAKPAVKRGLKKMDRIHEEAAQREPKGFSKGIRRQCQDLRPEITSHHQAEKVGQLRSFEAGNHVSRLRNGKRQTEDGEACAAVGGCLREDAADRHGAQAGIEALAIEYQLSSSYHAAKSVATHVICSGSLVSRRNAQI
jgi:hypothetical protein